MLKVGEKFELMAAYCMFQKSENCFPYLPSLLISYTEGSTPV